MSYVKTRKVLMFGLSFVGFLSIFTSQAIACSCYRPRAHDAVKGARVAFRGTVTKVDYLDEDTPQSEPRIVVTFSVSRVWKGTVGREFILHTLYNKYTCKGYYFKKDKEYLVFAYPNEEFMANRFLPTKNTWGTNYCNGTSDIESAKDYLSEIGKGRKPR